MQENKSGCFFLNKVYINIAILDQYLAMWETIQDRAISVAVFILYIHGVQKN